MDSTRGLRRQVTACIIANQGLFLIGINLGWSSAVNEHLLSGVLGYKYTQDQLSWAVSLLDLGTVFAPLPTGYLMNKIGRKFTFLLIASLFTLSWCLKVISVQPGFLYAAQILAGVARGVGLTVTPMYSGEIAETGLHGMLSTIFKLMFYSGMLLMIIVAPYMNYTTISYMGLTFSLLFFFSLFYIPDTPYYYCAVKKEREAFQSLKWLRNQDKTENASVLNKELAMIKVAIEKVMGEDSGFRGLIMKPSNRRALFIVLGLFILQRMIGLNTIIGYGSITLPKGHPFITPQTGMISFVVALFISSALIALFIDRIGTKPLLISSSIGCGFCTSVIAVYYWCDRTNGKAAVAGFFWVPYLFFVLEAFVFSIGVGVVPTVYLSQLFPINVVGQASAASVIVASFVTFVINKAYFYVGVQFGIFMMYVFFSMSAFGCAAFTHFFAIETRKKRDAEIVPVGSVIETASARK
nr:PREDICTED: facilitated trehalose transporter Tret1-like [Bemisia tabaci]